MTTTIDAPGLAKLSSGDLAKELTNEHARIRRRLKHAEQKLAAWPLMKAELKPYLQSGDYELIKERLQRDVERWKREEQDIAWRAHRSRHEKRLKEARAWMDRS